MGVRLTMVNEGEKGIVRADTTIEIACCIVWVDVLLNSG